MTNNPFEVYTDRLKHDEIEQIHETVEPALLELEEKDLSFRDKVHVEGQAYLANNHLILDLKLKATAIIPCSVCNGKAEINLSIDDFSQSIETSQAKSGIYNFKEDIRAAILLKIPQFAECNEGHCPQRKEVSKYLKKGLKNTHSPFSSLEIGS